jgi:hypothetical protein
VFAIGFISQGAIDATMYFLNYRHYNEAFIVLEIVTGFLLATFGGLLNFAMRAQSPQALAESESSEGVESSN